MHFLLSLYIVNCVVSGETYTDGKNFTLPPALTAWTNSTSAQGVRFLLANHTLFSGTSENESYFLLYLADWSANMLLRKILW